MDNNYMTQTLRSDTMSSNHRMDDLFQHLYVSNLNSPVLSAQFLSDDAFIALGCQDGCIFIISSTKGDVQYTLKSAEKSPISGLSSNPNSLSIKNAIMATHTDGVLEYWHSTSKQLLFSKNQKELLHACEISQDGQYYIFASGSGDIKMGHMNKDAPSNMQTGSIGSHINRVFCLKWHPYDSNLFLSGGWDRTVFMWDIRIKTAIHKIFGPFLGGQAIDVNDNDILLGSNTKQHPLRIYDVKASKIRSITWPYYSKEEQNHQTGVVCCSYGHSGGSEIIATSAHQQIRHLKEDKCISLFQYENSSAKIYCLANSVNKKLIVTGWSDGMVMMMKY